MVLRGPGTFEITVLNAGKRLPSPSTVASAIGPCVRMV
jgi:hypothetical protein